MIPAVSEGLFRFMVTFGASSNNSQTAGAALPTVPLGPNAYVADILEGGSTVFDNGINISDRRWIDRCPRAHRRRFDRRRCSGADKMPAGGATLVLVLRRTHRSNPRSNKTATSDAMGRFSLRGIAPGEYKVFAWANVPVRLSQSDFLKKYEGRGVPVNVVAGARLSSATWILMRKKVSDIDYLRILNMLASRAGKLVPVALADRSVQRHKAKRPAGTRGSPIVDRTAFADRRSPTAGLCQRKNCMNNVGTGVESKHKPSGLKANFDRFGPVAILFTP